MKRIMDNWLEHFKIKRHGAHCSGHASAKDIEKMVKRVKPDVLIPIHTANPELFADFHSDVRVVDPGERIAV